jgi:hypothetical protein
MEKTVWNIVRGIVGAGATRPCRRCDETINEHDQFGMSEGVCQPCRRGFDP